MAEFDTADEVVAAAHQANAAGYRVMDAFTPHPIHGLAEAIGFKKTKLPLVVLIGGLCGCIGGFGMQYWMAAVNYPLNIGGRPLNSWPAFIPVTFECTILVAALSGVLGMLALNGLPTPHHPVFNAPNFDLASRSRYFFCIETKDPKFEVEATRKFLEGLSKHKVNEVDY
jgi:hypothetical protein